MVIRNYLSVVPDLAEPIDESITIDCDQCAAQYTDACDDCLVSYVISREPGRPVEFEGEEANAVRLLAEAGLVPGSRFRRHQPVA